MACSISLTSLILCTSCVISGCLLRHLHAYRYCLVIIFIFLISLLKGSKPFTPKSISFSVKLMRVPVPSYIILIIEFQMFLLVWHRINKWTILSVSAWQNEHRSFGLIFHLKRWLLVIRAPCSILYWKSLSFVESVAVFETLNNSRKSSWEKVVFRVNCCLSYIFWGNILSFSINSVYTHFEIFSSPNSLYILYFVWGLQFAYDCIFCLYSWGIACISP